MIEEYLCAMSGALRTNVPLSHTDHIYAQSVYSTSCAWMMWMVDCVHVVHSKAEQSFEYASATTIWNLF